MRKPWIHYFRCSLPGCRAVALKNRVHVCSGERPSGRTASGDPRQSKPRGIPAPSGPSQDRREELEPCCPTLGSSPLNEDSPCPHATPNPFEILADLKEGEPACLRLVENKRKVRRIVKLLEADRGLKPRCGVVPYTRCGDLRRVVSSMYNADQLSLADRLSIKTSAKAEVKACSECEDRLSLDVKAWKEKRLQKVEVCPDHLERFAKMFRSNIPTGWNRYKTAYVPNGHACLDSSRREGGNWNQDVFKPWFDIADVQASGKRRVVTLYSEFNVRVLTPLHNSLYSRLQRKDWILSGAPTEKRLRESFGEMTGNKWLSFDYESATDNIKTAYVQRAVEELINAAPDLSSDELMCLRAMAVLKFSESEVSHTGQPMGSPMSFPLLCLINKTVVDMALTTLMLKKEISFKEWTSHRCLINGDDLLMKSTSCGDMVAAVESEGRQVGLVTNREKTMEDTDVAEINSTAFVNFKLDQKTNVSALWMGRDVEDVIGFARESCRSSSGLKKVVRKNHKRLAKAETKVSEPLPYRVKRALAEDRVIQRALLSKPKGFVRKPTNLFPVEADLGGLDLSREEEVASITNRVIEIRAQKLWLSTLQRVKDKREIVPGGQGMAKAIRALHWKKSVSRESVLSCLVDTWRLKQYQMMLAADPREDAQLPPSDLKPIWRMLDLIKTGKLNKENADRTIPDSPKGDPFSEGEGYVSLSGL